MEQLHFGQTFECGDMKDRGWLLRRGYDWQWHSVLHLHHSVHANQGPQCMAMSGDTEGKPLADSVRHDDFVRVLGSHRLVNVGCVCGRLFPERTRIVRAGHANMAQSRAEGIYKII
jgi:hypothetical protein